MRGVGVDFGTSNSAVARYDGERLEVLRLDPAAAGDVVVVVRTGGTSQIPAVRRRLAAHFGDRVVEHVVFTSITAGLALASWHGHASPLD